MEYLEAIKILSIVLSNWFSWFLLFIGCLFIFSGVIGFLRMPDFYTKIHAISISDTLGCLSILLALVFINGFSLISLKIILLLIFMLVTGPTATHTIANCAISCGLTPFGKNKDIIDESVNKNSL